MNGKTHAVSGAAAWVAVSPLIAYLPGVRLAELALGAVVTAGTAMLPDLDSPSSTIAYTFGFPTRLLARLVAKVSGGHRHGTHTAAFALVAALTVLALVFAGLAAWLVTLALGLGLRALGWTRTRPIDNLATFAVCAALAHAAVYAGMRFWWLPAAYGLGCLAHVLGDTFTVKGTRPWKPFTARWIRLGTVSTNSPFERRRIAPGLSALAMIVPALYLWAGWI